MKIQEQLSRRLHQFRPRYNAGAFYFSGSQRMVAHRKTLLLSETDAAYIAGLIDGEGTITLTRKHRNENRQLAVTISNTERGLLEFVLCTVGAGKITGKRTAHEYHTRSFTYAVYNRQALSLLEQIHPYLRTYKTERSALILRDYLSLTPRNGKYTESLRQKRKQFEDSVLGIKPGQCIPSCGSGCPIRCSRDGIGGTHGETIHAHGRRHSP